MVIIMIRANNKLKEAKRQHEIFLDVNKQFKEYLEHLDQINKILK